MARITKTVHVDLTGSSLDAARQLVRTYGGRVDTSFDTFVCARVPRTRLSHFKSTATKKGLTVDVTE